MSNKARSLIVFCLISMMVITLISCKSNGSEGGLNTLAKRMGDISKGDIENADIQIVAREGKGALLEQSGQRVLILRGTPYEMGYQHGVLLKDDIKALKDKVITTVSAKMPGGMEKAWDMAEEFIPKRYKEEMEGLADGAGVSLEEIRSINIFPELFHCSGLVLYGDATKDREFLHARILDYAVGHGLQKQSIVMIVQPDGYNTFINAGIAGLIGSVTGMNEQKIAFGEIGGKGEGDWAGIPMTLLIRKAMEETDTLKGAVNVFKKGPRTCEYFYVISDVKAEDARALYCTPDIFQAVKPGQSHRMLPKPPLKHTLIASARDRYLMALEKVEEHYGNIDRDILIKILKRPVSRDSNLHNAIFKPKDLKMFLAVANDPSKPNFQACYQNYYEYDMALILKWIENNDI